MLDVGWQINMFWKLSSPKIFLPRKQLKSSVCSFSMLSFFAFNSAFVVTFVFKSKLFARLEIY